MMNNPHLTLSVQLDPWTELATVLEGFGGWSIQTAGPEWWAKCWHTTVKGADPSRKILHDNTWTWVGGILGGTTVLHVRMIVFGLFGGNWCSFRLGKKLSTKNEEKFASWRKMSFKAKVFFCSVQWPPPKTCCKWMQILAYTHFEMKWICRVC